VSKPVSGPCHSWGNCGTHWDVFNQPEGRKEFCEKANVALEHYEKAFELSLTGEVLHKPENGFEPIFAAELPLSDDNVISRVNSSTLRFRRHGATIDDRRQAVRTCLKTMHSVSAACERS